MAVLIVLALAFYATARNDFALLEGTLLAAMLVNKLLHLVLVVVGLVLLRRARTPWRYDRVLAVLNIATGVSIALSQLTRLSVNEVHAPVIAGSAVLAVIYFAQRGPLWDRVVMAMLISLCTLPLLWNPEASLSSVLRTTGPLTLVGMNVVGIISARSFEEQRRQRFLAEHQAQLAQQELARRLRELAAEKEWAEAMSQARTTFLAAMSHEFRTPMNAVIGLSDLLRDAPLDPTHAEYVRTIHDSARGLLVLLNNILDLAKIDVGRLELSSAPFSPRALAASITTMMQPAVEHRDVEVAVTIEPGVPDHVLGDEARLRQVLVNLVANAVKFTERGRVRLSVGSQALDGDEHELRFAVEDTGIGIKPEVVSRLFRPFEQADVTISRRYGGTGLGLAISREIVQAMGSDIRVVSDVGRGSVFSFALRLPAVAAPVEVGVPQHARDASRRPLSILVADDLSVNQRVARLMLGRLGYEADCVGSGTEVLQAVEERDYDVIFLDLQMPDLSGIDVAHRLAQRLEGQRMPLLVAMTASVLEEDRAACRAAGMLEFVPKPVELSALAGALARAGEGESSRSELMARDALQNGSVSSLLRTDDEHPVPPSPPQKS